MTAEGFELRVEQAVSAGGVVYRRGERGIEIVLCGRSPEGLWALPKGTPERGEELRQTALREVSEETGLGVDIERELGTIHYTFTRPTQGVRFQKTVHHYLMHPSGVGSVDEHDGEYDRVQWFSVEEALRIMTHHNEMQVVRRAVEALRESVVVTTTVEGEVARGQLVVLREKRLGDAHNDFRWRTDTELARYDAARPFAATYHDYLALYRDELAYPSPYRRSLAIEDRGGQHIGNAMYYNIDTIRREAEIGITIGERDYWSKGYGTDAVRTLLRHVVRVTGFRRVYLKTLDWNARAQRAFEKAGFRSCGRSRRGGNSFVVMEYMSAWADLTEHP